MAQTSASETRVKDFGTLSPVHEEKEVSRSSLDIDPSTAHSSPLLRLWDRCPSGKCVGSTALSTQISHLPGKRHGKVGNGISLSDLVTLLSRRSSMRSRPSRILTAVNPNVRISRGLPLGTMETEILDYSINKLYGEADHLYKAGCLCKWDIMPGEIIGHWGWTAITENPCWYRAEILPAFEKHNSLIRDIHIATPVNGPNTHRGLPKAIPKVFTKVLPKAISALSHRSKNRSVGGTQSDTDVLPINQTQVPDGATGCGYVERENFSFSDGDDYISTRDADLQANDNDQAIPENYASENDPADRDHDGNTFEDAASRHENYDDANAYDGAIGDAGTNDCNDTYTTGTGDSYLPNDGLGFAECNDIGYSASADNYTSTDDYSGDTCDGSGGDYACDS